MTTVSVEVATSDDDAERTDRLTRQFRQELLELDVDAVTLASAHQASVGAKGDAVTIGTLVVTLASSRVLVSLCQLARTWVTRDHGRRITLKNGKRTLEISGANAIQHQQLVDAFLANTHDSDTSSS